MKHTTTYLSAEEAKAQIALLTSDQFVKLTIQDEPNTRLRIQLSAWDGAKMRKGSIRNFSFKENMNGLTLDESEKQIEQMLATFGIKRGVRRGRPRKEKQ